MNEKWEEYMDGDRGISPVRPFSDSPHQKHYRNLNTKIPTSEIKNLLSPHHPFPVYPDNTTKTQPSKITLIDSFPHIHSFPGLYMPLVLYYLAHSPEG